jgi:hypothetical protein
VAADAEIAEREAPEGMTPFPRLLLTGELIATVPDNENPALVAAYGDPGDPVAYCDYPTVDPNGTGFWEALGAFRRDHWPHHQIGGYAMPVQGAVEPEAAHVLYQDSDEHAAAAGQPAEGGEQGKPDGQAKPDDAAIRQLASQLVLLAQIDSDSRSGMAWGDTGRLYWLIRSEDLAAGRFEKSTFTWQSE